MTSSEWYRFIKFTNKSGCVKSEDFMKYLDYFAQNPNDSEVDSIQTVKENLAKAYKSITKRDFNEDYPNVWNYSPTSSRQHAKIETKQVESSSNIDAKKTVIAWPKAGKIAPENEKMKNEIISYENDPQPGCSSSTNPVPFETVLKLECEEEEEPNLQMKEEESEYTSYEIGNSEIIDIKDIKNINVKAETDNDSDTDLSGYDFDEDEPQLEVDEDSLGLIDEDDQDEFEDPDPLRLQVVEDFTLIKRPRGRPPKSAGDILQSMDQKQHRFRGRPATAPTMVTEEELKAEIPPDAPPEQAKYHRMRIFNNAASKRCRLNRKRKQAEIEIEEAREIERNEELKSRLFKLQEQVAKLKKLIEPKS